ncbi:MAG: hemerythrin domain-containing protein [Candidatus Methanomethylophilaceae archaeon]|nr:hemerythrin domain-containing protein [Candidatus Methanomethylophilaceae archaeon]
MRISVTLVQYEHGILRQALDVLDETVRNNSEDHMDDVKELISFLHEFVDRFHHAKEEQLFYPVIVKEFPRFQEEVDGIYAEHQHAREQFQLVERALEEGDWDSMASAASELVHHMTSHVQKEEDGIFPVVDDELSLPLDEQLNQAYQVFTSEFGDDYYQRAEMFANDIQDRLLGPGFFNHGIY